MILASSKEDHGSPNSKKNELLNNQGQMVVDTLLSRGTKQDFVNSEEISLGTIDPVNANKASNLISPTFGQGTQKMITQAIVNDLNVSSEQGRSGYVQNDYIDPKKMRETSESFFSIGATNQVKFSQKKQTPTRPELQSNEEDQYSYPQQLPEVQQAS